MKKPKPKPSKPAAKKKKPERKADERDRFVDRFDLLDPLPPLKLDDGLKFDLGPLPSFKLEPLDLPPLDLLDLPPLEPLPLGLDFDHDLMKFDPDLRELSEDFKLDFLNEKLTPKNRGGNRTLKKEMI